MDIGETPIMLASNIPIHKQKLKKDTFVICAIIYRKWLV